MHSTIEKLLAGQTDNHLMPFLWVHGEPEETYRRMVKAIYDANLRAFCVEARPHKEFAREGWWRDVDIILDEAQKRGMKVWILDDKHFPTGYANGGVEDAPPELRRWGVCHRTVRTQGGKTVSINLHKYIHPQNHYDAISYIMLLLVNNKRPPRRQRDDRLLSVTAYGQDAIVDLSPFIQNGRLRWEAPPGSWTVEVCALSRNTGMHRNYINMMMQDACRIQIEQVYEPHYERYKNKFGTVIAGFFSDEPELGNGNYCKHYNPLGTAQDLPYSDELAVALEKRLGLQWKTLLPLLWKNDHDSRETARVRYLYMDCVTRVVEKDFSMQIGEWCREHGVEYIGHVIEDNNQHARTSTSLGHFFRGLKGQTMAGIDDIGGQVRPGGEDDKNKFIFGYVNDGEFYHYALGKLGSSLGALNPRMMGRTMCEIFGNYGWGAGVRLQKYLLDHFLVRGVNYFVPHAFNSKAYPDKDCPPHFYAHGHNPQYRHFGALMAYADRVCTLLTGGKIATPVAILYHAEAEWAGKCMLMQKPARVLMDNQIDFNFVPSDVFAERDFYRTEVGRELTINGRTHKAFVVPYAQFITKEVAQGIVELRTAGCPVAFVDALPEGICTGEDMPQGITRCDVVTLDGLPDYLGDHGLREIRLTPGNDRIRCLRYLGEREVYMLFNEGDQPYRGTVKLPTTGPSYAYDAWNNRKSRLDTSVDGITVLLHPSESMLIVFDDPMGAEAPLALSEKKIPLKQFHLSVCRSIDYPNFTTASVINPKFSGFIRYQAEIELPPSAQPTLEITDAHEGVEVFANGQSAGIQVIPPFRYDLTPLCKEGKNELTIEVATTLERERGKVRNAAPVGITDDVNLIIHKREA